MVHIGPVNKKGSDAPDWKLQAKEITDESAIGIEVEPPRTSTTEQICLITMLTQALIIESPKRCQHLLDQVLICTAAFTISEGNTKGFGHPLPAGSVAGHGKLKEILFGHLKCARVPVTQDGFSGTAQSQYGWQA